MTTDLAIIKTNPVKDLIVVKTNRPSGKRIAGVHVEENGDIGVVWINHDKGTKKNTDCVLVYDSFVYRNRQDIELIAGGFKRRGAHIPIAWEEGAEELAKRLKECGCVVLREGYKDSPMVCEMNCREIVGRMKTGSFEVWDNNAEWVSEWSRFNFQDDAIPQAGFSLISATRHAMHNLRQARGDAPIFRKIVYPHRGVGIV